LNNLSPVIRPAVGAICASVVQKQDATVDAQRHRDAADARRQARWRT
jgi:hypothetical protein